LRERDVSEGWSASGLAILNNVYEETRISNLLANLMYKYFLNILTSIILGCRCANSWNGEAFVKQRSASKFLPLHVVVPTGLDNRILFKFVALENLLAFRGKK